MAIVRTSADEVIFCQRCSEEGLFDVLTKDGRLYVATNIHGNGGILRGRDALYRARLRVRGYDGPEPRQYIEVYLNWFENRRLRIPIDQVAEVTLHGA